MATIEERFQAAVNVIKGLPKNGPYQPSNAMMLKFYGYYKQATEGPCHQKKPAFWDVVGKAKWEAWNKNRHLTKHQAMTKYVECLREIIETMSFTENVQNFVGSINGLDINLNDLDTVVPGMRKIAETHPDSPFNSRTHSPQRDGSFASLDDNSLTNDLPNGHAIICNGNNNHDVQDAGVENHSFNSGVVDQSDEEYVDPFDIQHDFYESMAQQSEVLQQIQMAVRSMNTDLLALNERTAAMQHCLNEMYQQQKHKSNTNKISRNSRNWWPFKDISPLWFLILVLWPFAFRRMNRLFTTKRH